MNGKGKRRSDPGIEEIRGTRRRLVEEHGGIEGWGRHLMEIQRRLPSGKVIRKRKPKE